MVKILKLNSDEKIDVVEMKEFRTEIDKIWSEIERLKLLSSPKTLKKIKKIGKETVKTEEIKPKKEKSPIEELLEV
jgi:SMC interacting uncharacterized protein involved in chromosome segregation